jgi:uncharacterized protein YpmS
LKVKNWKALFFLLVSINLFILFFFIIILTLPSEDQTIQNKNQISQGYVPFLIQTEKENLNEVINHYIKKEAAGGPIQYQVQLRDEVELYGAITIFNDEIQMKMTFEPRALDNGDLILEQKSISIGKMKLPVTYVLKFIEERYKLPKGVIIQPNKKLVYISMQNLKLKSEFKVKVHTFNLNTDDISFQLYVPTK